MRKTGRRDTRRGCPGADAVIAFIIYWCTQLDVCESPAWSESSGAGTALVPGHDDGF